MKKGKVTKVTKFAKKDDFGNTSYSIEIDNGDVGYYRSKEENQTYFVVGTEVEYEIESKEGKNGKTYHNIKKPASEKKPFFGGKSAPDPKTQMISFAAAYSKDLIVANKAELKDFDKVFDVIYTKMISKI